MTWTDVTTNWPSALTRLEQRFPYLDRRALRVPPESMHQLTHHVAERHDLTLFEAREELEDWLYVEELAQVCEPHPG